MNKYHVVRRMPEAGRSSIRRVAAVLPVAANFNGFLQQNRPQGDIPSAGRRAVKSVADPGIEACIVARHSSPRDHIGDGSNGDQYRKAGNPGHDLLKSS